MSPVCRIQASANRPRGTFHVEDLGSKALKYVRKSWKRPIQAMELWAVWADGAPKAAVLRRQIRCGAGGCVPCTTQGNSAQGKTAQHNTAQGNTTQHNTTQHNTAQHNTAQGNTTQHNTTQHNSTQLSTTQHSSGQLSTGPAAQCGAGQRGAGPLCAEPAQGRGGPRMSPQPLVPRAGACVAGSFGRGWVWGPFAQGWGR